MVTDARARWQVRTVGSPAGVVAAVVAGDPVRAWSSDIQIADVPEAWPTAFALPAARAGVALEVPRRLDSAWRAGVDANLALASEWWGGEARLRIVEPGGVGAWFRDRQNRRSGQRSEPADGRALYFTAGVDSFFSLLCSPEPPTHLVFVAGFDVELGDSERLAAMVASLRAVAHDVGVRPVVVSTDLRRHPSFASISWEHTHGAALATIGHLMHPTIGTVTIAPSYGEARLIPWGSRPDLDPRWSVPGRTMIRHGDASGIRLDRIFAIASHPLVHEHLRVCWQNVAGTLNCGRCEKCLRTMVVFAATDQLQNIRTFPDRAELPRILDESPPIHPIHIRAWQDFVDLPLRPDEHAAVVALVARST